MAASLLARRGLMKLSHPAESAAAPPGALHSPGAPHQGAGRSLQQAASAGYTLGSTIARSQLNATSKVIDAQHGEGSFAIKYTEDPEGEQLKLLQDEYEILRRVTHPGIVCVFGLYVARQDSAMVMESVPGQPLCVAMSTVPRNDFHHMVAQILGVVDYMHNDAHVVHRDIKPENVMVGAPGPGGQGAPVKLIDFGSAREIDPLPVDDWCRQISCASMASSFHDNTDPRILPPAHQDGRGCDAGLDVFAVGLVIVGLLARREVFTSSVYAGGAWVMRLPEVSEAADEFVRAILNPNPAMRPAIDSCRSSFPPCAAWLGRCSPSLGAA